MAGRAAGSRRFCLALYSGRSRFARPPYVQRQAKTNVYRANTLDPKMWSEDARAGLRPRLRRFKNADDDQENQKTFRYFDFDVLMTNRHENGLPPALHGNHMSKKSPMRTLARNGLVGNSSCLVAKDLPISREHSPSHRQFTGEAPRSAYLTPMVLGQAH